MSLTLDPNDLIGVGRTRECFRHPSEPGKCIKVMKDQSSYDVNQIEYEYYQYLTSKKKDISCLPMCYGFVETNLGKGLTFDLVEDGKTLEDHLKAGKIGKESALTLLNQLKRQLIRNGISYMDTKLSNLIISEGKLIVIDGIVPVRPRRLKIYGYIWFMTTLKTLDKMRKARQRVIELKLPTS